MSTAAIFLMAAAGAAIVGSLLLSFGHRVRRTDPPDFQEQLRAIAPVDPNRSVQQPSGIVQLDPMADEER